MPGKRTFRVVAPVVRPNHSSPHTRSLFPLCSRTVAEALETFIASAQLTGCRKSLIAGFPFWEESFWEDPGVG